ncbi:MAG: CBS domain-containing protein, partial [Thaumarchaeota archaeon]|nr:CBS domain-containing protein [Nitrososphaerota archaeon]
MVLFAKDVVEPVFLSLPRDITALDAAKIMREKNQGFIVVSAEGVPEGIVTEWDYISKVVSEGVDPAKVKLAQLMTAGLITVQGSDGLDVVARVMTEKGVRRVIVVQDGKVLG